MAFSDKVYTYDALERAARNFASPSVEIRVDNTVLKPEEYPLTSVEVNIPVTVGTDKKNIEQGQCTFTIAGLFDAKLSKLKIEPYRVFRVGKTVVVKMGYVSRIEVFKGFICQVSIQYEAEGPIVQVSALDASYILCGAYQTRSFEIDATQTVRQMLGKAAAGGMASIKRVDTLSKMNKMLNQVKMDDCALLTLLARRNGFVFAFIHGDILFCNLLTSAAAAIIELRWGQSLMSFQKQLNTNRQVEKVIAYGSMPNRENIKCEVNRVTLRGSGDTAAQMDSHIKGKAYELTEAALDDRAGIDRLAQAVLNDLALRFVSGKGSCIGLPELIPGRYIKLSGMGPKLDGEYFLTRVVHRMDANGFLTSFEVKGAWS